MSSTCLVGQRASLTGFLGIGFLVTSLLSLVLLLVLAHPASAQAPAGFGGGCGYDCKAAVGTDETGKELPAAMPPHPDLVKKLGKAGIQKLRGEETPESMFTEMRDLRAKSGLKRISGTGTCLIILWEFTDHPADTMNHPNSAYVDLLFSTGTYPTGSMNDFYLENSYGAYGVSGDVNGWTTANGLYSDYEEEDGSHSASTTRVMLEDAVAQLDPTLDFSLYDNDGPDGIPDSGDDDGYVDALFFVHAGPGQEQTGDPYDIWSHAWGFYPNGLATNDGVAIRRYSVEPEELENEDLMTVGVFVHEYGHVLGLPDLYDTDSSSSGIGEWGVMSGGSWTHRPDDNPGSRPSHFTAWSKIQMGWLTPITVTSSSYGVTIPPAEYNAVAYRIFRDGVTSGDEYFLCENRRNLGFDEGLLRRQILFDLTMPEGLIIYHVDDGNSGNSNDTHRLVDVVEASPWFNAPDDWYETLDGVRIWDDQLQLNKFNRGDNGDLWPGFTAFLADSTDWVEPRDRIRFADDTIPPAEDYFCDPTGIAIENITLVGEDITADFVIGAGKKIVPILAKEIQTWDFENDIDFWQFCRSFVHHDTNYGDGCPGEGGLWFGVDDPNFECPPGYGNHWNDFTWETIAIEVSEGSTITIRHKYDLENDYDFAYIEVRCAGDPGAAWHELASFTGTSTCVTNEYTIPQYVLNECNMDGLAWLDLRLRFVSDGGYSAQDGYFCGLGWWVDEVSVSGTAVTGVGDDLPGMGLPAVLMPASPNPFNPLTVIRFHVPAGAKRIELSVYDQRGRLVRTLISGQSAAGWREENWDGRDLSGRRQPSGVYFAKLDVDGEVQIQKMALVK